MTDDCPCCSGEASDDFQPSIDYTPEGKDLRKILDSLCSCPYPVGIEGYSLTPREMEIYRHGFDAARDTAVFCVMMTEQEAKIVAGTAVDSDTVQKAKRALDAMLTEQQSTAEESPAAGSAPRRSAGQHGSGG